MVPDGTFDFVRIVLEMVTDPEEGVRAMGFWIFVGVLAGLASLSVRIPLAPDRAVVTWLIAPTLGTSGAFLTTGKLLVGERWGLYLFCGVVFGLSYAVTRHHCGI